ncbi:acylphosphatase [Nesterenkonia sp. LB17]|uniref:acylphosphatase n=1 Tax=unclassified Nesterenkonia TaxID=2629769 RepID=UPI001F4C92AF|nr:MULTISPECIES: acylphosphatase [unclassified Nesterenkonia]MCH8559791.1 acylphosphatase [Nesterenkonia sp. DZ6]MCH8564508.1 acylphosphatase [Nesterenkonia sp. LB17]MCH8570134.1 acylphosphatase [Nesterenkonia sp. AY15]
MTEPLSPPDSEQPLAPSGCTTGTHAQITGRVQGVTFRASTKAEADDLGLIGWVRNTADGAVELLVGGDGPAVDALLRWAGKGPESAEVTEVQQREATEADLASLPQAGFEIRR